MIYLNDNFDIVPEEQATLAVVDLPDGNTGWIILDAPSADDSLRDQVMKAAFDPAKHPHKGKGEGGGQFAPKGEGGSNTEIVKEGKKVYPAKGIKPAAHPKFHRGSMEDALGAAVQLSLHHGKSAHVWPTANGLQLSTTFPKLPHGNEHTEVSAQRLGDEVHVGLRRHKHVAPEPKPEPKAEPKPEASAQRPAEPDKPLTHAEKYPQANKTVDGLRVMDGPVKNASSIGASLTDWDELKGIREVPVADFPGASARDMFSAADDHRRVDALAEQIKDNQEISPLIVVVDKDGPYILEGAHRLAALDKLGKKSFPAMVVIDRDEQTGVDNEPTKKNGPPDEPRTPDGKWTSGTAVAEPPAPKVESPAPASTAEFVDSMTRDDVKEWGAALDSLTGADDQYKAFVENLMHGAFSKLSDHHYVGLRDGGKLQGLMEYHPQAIRPGRESASASKTAYNIAAEKGGLRPGVYLVVDRLAVAPWHHPSQPGRVKGYGTKTFMDLVRRLTKTPAMGILLQSKTPQSDLFYDALGLQSINMGKTRTGEHLQYYALTKEDGNDLYAQYKAGAGLRKGYTKRGLDISAKAQPGVSAHSAA
jgi:hypothetical protein